jgi:alkylation response protein AidB-like acyl-CoA dehydrogenase
MDFAFTPDAEKLRGEIRSVLMREWPAGRLGYRKADADLDYAKHVIFRRRLARHGWFGIGTPADYGGAGGGIEERYIVASELAFHGVIYPKVAFNMIGPTILEHGTEELKRKFLPLIARGEVEFAQSYSEPDAGSDLAALKTTFVPDGHEWVINGQKLYTSFMHRCEYVVVAAREPGTSGSAGISLLIVDVHAPGIEYRPLWGMGRVRTNVVFYDQVRTPASWLLGREGHGWASLRSALGFERLISFGVDSVRPIFWDLVDQVADSEDLRTDVGVRRRLAELFVDLERLDALTRSTLWELKVGMDVGAKAAQVKVIATELRQQVTKAALDILGPVGTLTSDDPLAPAQGALLQADEAAVMPTFGGGGNEVLRDLIGRSRHSGSVRRVGG